MLKINKDQSTIDGYQVGILPGWLLKIWFCKQIKGMALRKSFLLRADLYQSLFSNSPSTESLGISLHEIEHIKRADKIGFWNYHLKYRLSPKFRYQEELACYKVQFKYYKQKNFTPNLEKIANGFSGPTYFWMVKKKLALRDLSKLWSEM